MTTLGTTLGTTLVYDYRTEQFYPLHSNNGMNTIRATRADFISGRIRNFDAWIDSRSHHQKQHVCGIQRRSATFLKILIHMMGLERDVCVTIASTSDRPEIAQRMRDRPEDFCDPGGPSECSDAGKRLYMISITHLGKEGGHQVSVVVDTMEKVVYLFDSSGELTQDETTHFINNNIIYIFHRIGVYDTDKYTIYDTTKNYIMPQQLTMDYLCASWSMYLGIRMIELILRPDRSIHPQMPPEYKHTRTPEERISSLGASINLDIVRKILGERLYRGEDMARFAQLRRELGDDEDLYYERIASFTDISLLSMPGKTNCLTEAKHVSITLNSIY